MGHGHGHGHAAGTRIRGMDMDIQYGQQDRDMQHGIYMQHGSWHGQGVLDCNYVRVYNYGNIDIYAKFKQQILSTVTKACFFYSLITSRRNYVGTLVCGGRRREPYSTGTLL
jgi:hypothetical protein